MLKLWIFTPDLSVSTSVRDSVEPVRMVKVMWQLETQDARGAPARLTTAALAEDELRLMPQEVAELHRILDQSTKLLVPGSRTFQQWHVGLIERFNDGDVK